MSISFEIQDITSLTGVREQRVNVTGLSCGSGEADLAKHLTDAVVQSVKAYVEKKQTEKQ